MRHVEHYTQSACVRWFRMQYREYASLLFAVPNGGARNKLEAVRLKQEGVTAGVSDLILLVQRGGFGGLCIEMKTMDKTSRQSQTQKQWQQEVESQGYKYVVIRNVEQFEEEINKYMRV